MSSIKELYQDLETVRWNEDRAHIDCNKAVKALIRALDHKLCELQAQKDSIHREIFTLESPNVSTVDDWAEKNRIK